MLQEREIEIARFLSNATPLHSAPSTRLALVHSFSPLANLLLKDTAASLAKIAPTTALTNASGLPERKFLAERFKSNSS